MDTPICHRLMVAFPPESAKCRGSRCALWVPECVDESSDRRGPAHEGLSAFWRTAGPKRWFAKNPKWQKEINLMIEKGIKAEIEALSHRGLKFMSEEYLPEKIKKKDFLD